jgi:two-component system cell cycle response regulator DivK
MIADDTTDTRELYAMYFRTRGFSVVTAQDGEAAVAGARTHRPDVIVMDLAMPRLDGIAATERVKADVRTRRTRIIILTGYPYRAIEQGALEAGADMFLIKPCLPEDLERHVNELRRPRRDRDK